jgi:Toastrack DUF4097
MKTRLPLPFLRCLLAAALTTVTVARSHADEDGASASVKLSAPDKPATLRVDVPWADIRIVGVDGDTVTVNSTLAKKGKKEARPDGLRRLDDEVSFELTEKDNVVTLHLAGDNPWASRDAEFKIAVPRAMALDVKTDTGGELAVKDVEGDIEVSNMNGEVRLDGIAGSAVVNTMNGEVRATYARPPQKLVAITSMNGEVDLRVPSETKANVRLRTHNGSILTDFPEDVLKTKSEGSSVMVHGEYGRDMAARMSADAAHAAADAARIAVQVARDVSREVARATQEAAGAADAEAAEDSDAGTPARAPRAPRQPRPPMPPIIGGKIVTGTLNGGGVEIKISTMNGEITLRQTK